MIRHSAIYEGQVRHRRRTPFRHEFGYRLFLLYLDLDELPELFRGRWLWSAVGPNVAWFRRADHFGPPEQPLAESVRDVVEQRLGFRPGGAIRLLTHLRYCGFVMNPISLYYCYDAGDELACVVAEVHNTPWGERHCYVLDARGQAGRIHARARKEFHVSPFLDMPYDYEFVLSRPGAGLLVRITNHAQGAAAEPAVFDAALVLRRRAWSAGGLARVLLRYPLITLQVYAAIYWQALKLWWRGAPLYNHPRNRPTAVSPAAPPLDSPPLERTRV